MCHATMTYGIVCGTFAVGLENARKTTGAISASGANAFDLLVDAYQSLSPTWSSESSAFIFPTSDSHASYNLESAPKILPFCDMGAKCGLHLSDSIRSCVYMVIFWGHG